MSKPTSELEKKILEKLAKTTSIAKTMNECLWVGDVDHKTVYVNPMFEKVSGYSLEDAIGMPCLDFFDEDGKKIIGRHHGLRTVGRSSQYEANMLSKSGKKIPLLISGAPMSDGGTIGVFTNLSKIKSLSRQDRISQMIIRNSQEAIVVLDKNRKIKLWNNGARKLFGFKEKEILNKSISMIIPESEEEFNLQMLREVEQKNFIKNVEGKRRNNKGEIVEVSISVTKVKDENEVFIGSLVIYRDISEIKKANTELQKRFEAIQDAYKELGLQKRQSDYLAEIAAMAVSSDSLPHLETLIVSACCMLTKCDGVILRSYGQKTKTLTFRTGLGINQNWVDKSKITLSGSLAEEAFERGRPLIIHNIDDDMKHKGQKLLKTHKFKTLILLPLKIGNRLIGTISLYSIDAAKFRLIEKDFLQVFANQCALALFAKSSKKSGKTT